ncbi:MAG TPA: isoprenylcysteine carboxylmethyltransferase family protein [Candidatus Angelobacter sp.]
MPSGARIASLLRVPLGFLLALAYLWFARPNWTSILLGSVFIFLGLGVRAVAAGHIRKNTQLAISGPYAYMRNPLYAGSIIMAVGFIVAGQNIWIGLPVGIMFIVIYVPVMLAEEKYLGSLFPEYEEYAAQVPRFLPRVTPYRAGNRTDPLGFSRELYMRYREYNALIGSALMLAALILKLTMVKH